MKTTRFYFNSFCFILVCLIKCYSANGQEPIAANGKFATVKGIKLYYEDTGKGVPLILLHGFTQTNSSWRPFIGEFSKFYRVITIDLPGHGRSDYMDTTEIYSHKKAAEYIVGLFHELHLDSAYVMGGSSGGIITLYIATIDPGITKKIVVIAGQTYFSTTTRKVISSIGPGTENPERMESLSKVHGKFKGRLLLRQFWHFRNLYGDPAFTADLLSTIKAKTLIIHGDNDPIAPLANAWEMYQYIQKANLWVIPNGGHEFLFIPANYTDFERRVLEFLRGDWERK